MERTLRNALESARECMLAWLNPEHDHMPTGGWEAAHDTGRWWDAMLRVEASIGRSIPAEAEAAMLRNLHLLTDNGAGLLMNRPDIPWLAEKAKVNRHNFRETMIAMVALARLRRSAWAVEAGRRFVGTLDRILDADGNPDFEKLQKMLPDLPLFVPGHGDDTTDGTNHAGRCLEALVRFYEATGDDRTLDVADRIARWHRARTLRDDGAMPEHIVDEANIGHNHSYNGTLRGLLLWGILTGQRDYVDAVSATFDGAVTTHCVTPSGYAPHDLGRRRFDNDHGEPVGEDASCGDAIQLALWLGLRCGRADLLDDVERWMRSRILPAQITEEDFAPDATPDPRRLGGWGVHAHPHGKGCILDVLAAVAHTVCDVHDHVVTRTPLGLRINLHFSGEYDGARLHVDRDDDVRAVTVAPRDAGPCLIRIPGWTPEERLTVERDGRPVSTRRIGRYLRLDADPEMRPVTLRYGLPRSRSEETAPHGRTFRFEWLGDEVVSCSPDGPVYS